MIFFDVTKQGAARHRSGLMRVGARLREELGAAAQEAVWPAVREAVRPDDWFVTAELFSEEERPGFGAFVRARGCRTAAIFHDAIPLKLPHLTWPHSVARHPGYLKALADFTRVFANSEASRAELVAYWQWLGVATPPPVTVLPLGSDFNRAPRTTARPSSRSASLLCVGILEPRKNQLFLLEVCEGLWGAGLGFELNFVGRVNPHFGAPVVARIKALRKKYPGLRHHEAAPDTVLAALYAGARATVFPTIAEGCGLPLLESLWHGVPCVCSDLPVLRENSDGGGCVAVPLSDRAAWAAALRRVLTDDAYHAQLTAEAMSRPLPTWRETARMLHSGLT